MEETKWTMPPLANQAVFYLLPLPSDQIGKI